nr:hypothetical protein [Tanacetum cinerariifolium]
MDLFAFIRHFDPTKVRIRERELAEREVGLLKMTEGRTVPLSPPATTTLEDSGDTIDKLFDDDDREHAIEKSDDVLEETIAKDASTVVAEKVRKKQKRKVVGDASGSTYPLKKLRDDHQSLLPNTGRKSLAALRVMVLDGSAIPSRATEPLIATFVAHVLDAGPLDSVFRPNLRTCPPHVRYVVSSDGSRHLGSYSKTNSFVRSPAADAPVVTVAVTTIFDSHVAAGSKAKDVSKYFKNIGYSTSVGGVNADAANISRLKKTSTSSDSFYASQSLDTETMHRVYILRWKLYSEFNIGAARQVCLGAEVRMRAEHTLERKCELEDKCAEHTTILSEKDAEIAHLKSLLSLKETEAAEAISLQSQLSVMETANAAKSTELRDLKEQNFALEGDRGALSQRVTTLESVTTSKESELASLSSQKSSLESAFELFRERIEALQDEQAKALGSRTGIGCAVNKESKKDSSIVDLMDSLCFEGTLAEIPRAEDLQPSLEQLMLPIHRLKDNVVFAETSLSFSLEIVDQRVQRFTEDDNEKRLSLTDVMNPFVEPLSSKSLTGDASSFAAPITTLSTTFASSAVIPPSPVVSDQVLGARPHGKDPPVMTFEKEELSTSPE